MATPLHFPDDDRLGVTTEFGITFERAQGFDRFACWLNGWLPFGVRLGRTNGRRRFLRLGTKPRL